jgi:hypothetical protein
MHDRWRQIEKQTTEVVPTSTREGAVKQLVDTHTR